MRLSLRFLSAPLAAFALTASPLHAADQSVDLAETMKAMNDLRVAESEAIGAFIGSTAQLENLLSKQPDTEGLGAAATTLDAAYKSYDSAAAAVRKLLDSTKMTAWEGKEKLAEDVSTKSLSEFKAIADAMNQVVSSMQKSTFTVYASEGWENSGLNVAENDLVYVQSDGAWTVSRNGWPTTDSQGYAGQANNSYAINRDAPLGALLFRVRGSSNQRGFGFDNFGKGSADANGRLEFIINDSDRSNNEGQLTLTIHHFKASALADFIKAVQAASASDVE